MAQQQLCLFVLGMHRSGTSALTGVLKLAGVKLGDNLMPANEFNPKGYFEHNDAVFLNDKILETLHSRWDEVFLLPKNWQYDPALEPLKKEIRQFILSEFAKDRLFAIKDPRLCITLPLWQQAMDALGIGHRYLIMVRDPEEISYSLARREDFSAEKSYLIWATSLLEIEKNTRAYPRIFIDYQGDLLQKPVATLEKVIGKFNLSLSVDKCAAEIKNFLDPQLKHYSTSNNVPATLPPYMEVLKSCFIRLVEGPAAQHPSNEEFDQLGLMLQNNISLFYHQEMLAELNNYKDLKKDVAQKQIHINNLSLKNNQLENDIRVKYEEIKTKEELLKKNYEQLKAANDLLLSKDYRIKALYEQSVVNEKQLSLLQEQLATKERQLEEEKLGQAREYSAFNAELTDTKAKLSAIYQDIEFLKKELTERGQQLVDAQQKLVASEAQYNSLEHEYHLKQGHANDLENYVLSLVNELNGLKSSLSFRLGKILTAPVRIPYNWLAGGKSGKNSLLATGATMAAIGLSRPVELTRHLNVKNFRTLQKALKNESPATIVQNFKQLLLPAPPPGSGNINQPPKKIADVKVTDEKKIFSQQKKKELSAFLASDEKLSFPHFTEPAVSVLLLFYNRAELSFDCLKSILKNVHIPYEVVIIDNASTDETHQLLAKITGVKIVKNNKNVGFVGGCNQAAQQATGEYLLFLNNDTYLYEHSLEAAYDTIEKTEKCGAVGGKILLLDGKLQEAGSIVWQDGSCLGYGRNEGPNDPEFMFRREVDFCSGAFLLTPAELFKEIGGFNTAFSPAYYEEVDYCMNLHKRGYKVVYEPNAIIKHFEFASSASSDNAIKLQIKNRNTFCQIHQTQLTDHFKPAPENILEARFSATVKSNKKVLYIDDRVPHVDTGSGFPRSNMILNSLVKIGYQVTMLPLNFPREEGWGPIYRDIDKSVEVAVGTGRKGFDQFLEKRAGYYDIIWVSRPHNMSFFNQRLDKIRACFPHAKIIYDAEAIFANRDYTYAQLKNDQKSLAESKAKMTEELELAKGADLIITVTEGEKKSFLDYGYENVEVVDVAFNITPTKNSFQEREGLLFVGNLDYDESPNVDSLVWFVEKVLPLVTEKIGAVPIHIVGSNKSQKINALENENNNIVLHGKVPHLYDYFNRARLFIAPTRYAAGSPAKVWQAAAFGLPTIATALIMQQLQWLKRKEIEGGPWHQPEVFADKLVEVYTSSELWNSMHHNLIAKMEREASPERYFSNLKSILKNIEASMEGVNGQEQPKRKMMLDTVEDRKFFFIHIPKTAGSSFKKGLSRVFRLDEIFANNDLQKANNKKYPPLKEYVGLKSNDLKKLKLLVGHVPFAIGNVFPDSPAYLVFLRDPVERAISRLLYSQKFLGMEDQPIELVYKRIKNKLFNLQTRMFADNDINKLNCFEDARLVDYMALGSAKKNLSTCDFIGITEDFETSVKIVNKMFGWNIDPEVKVNVNKNKKVNLIPEHILREIKEGNQIDMEFYEYALELFEEQKSKYLRGAFQNFGPGSFPPLGIKGPSEGIAKF